MIKYNLMVRGRWWDMLLCSIYARDLKDARRQAKEHIEDGDDWYLRRQD